MIGWLLAAAADVPYDDSWLLAEERDTLAGLHVEKRRTEWRLGRWAAKQAVAATCDVAAVQVRVQAATDGAPEAWLATARLPVSLSISHRSGHAAAAVASPPKPIGCDLELVESRAPVFTADWFSPAERALVDAAPPEHRDLLVTVIWSAKESALKALRSGLRRDTRSVIVSTRANGHDGWQSLGVFDNVGGGGLAGWWRGHDDLVLTVVAPSLARPPERLTRANPS